MANSMYMFSVDVEVVTEEGSLLSMDVVRAKLLQALFDASDEDLLRSSAGPGDTSTPHDTIDRYTESEGRNGALVARAFWLDGYRYKMSKIYNP